MNQAPHNSLPPRLSLRAGPVIVTDLGLISYDHAWDLQQRAHARIFASRPVDAAREQSPLPPVGELLLLEHSAVITVTARPGAAANLLASPQQLVQEGIELKNTNRGGDITYHGPGQLVVYPILDLNRLGLRLHDYVRLLELAVIDTLSGYGVRANTEPGFTGVWIPRTGDSAKGGSAKIAAIGVRVSRWITLHGLALNINPDMAHFNLIVPCGLAGRPVTSLARMTAPAPSPTIASVKLRLTCALEARLAALPQPPNPAHPD